MNDTVLFAIAIFAGLALYFIPSFLAGDKRNKTAIFWLNLLAGWTFLGWIAALVWALTKDEEQPKPRMIPVALPLSANQPPSSSSPEARLARLKSMRDKGLLTQEEFMEQVSKLTA
jgi:hypothetical protein